MSVYRCSNVASAYWKISNHNIPSVYLAMWLNFKQSLKCEKYLMHAVCNGTKIYFLLEWVRSLIGWDFHNSKSSLRWTFQMHCGWKLYPHLKNQFFGTSSWVLSRYCTPQNVSKYLIMTVNILYLEKFLL